MSHAHDWTPGSWKSKPTLQQPNYPDPAAVEAAVVRLSELPPLVTSWEIENLKEQLAGAARGFAFQVVEGLGAVPRRQIGGQLRALKKADFGRLRRLGEPTLGGVHVGRGRCDPDPDFAIRRRAHRNRARRRPGPTGRTG